MPKNVPFITTSFSLIFPLNIYDGRAANHTNSYHSLIFDYRCKHVHIRYIKKKCESRELKKKWNEGTKERKKERSKIEKKICPNVVRYSWNGLFDSVQFITVYLIHWSYYLAIIQNSSSFMMLIVDIVRCNPIGPIISIRFSFIIHLWFMKCGTSQLYLNNLETNRSA